MSPAAHLNDWELFRRLCRVLGAAAERTLESVVAAGELPQLAVLAARCDVLPALAVRCGEQLSPRRTLALSDGEWLRAALKENTQRNLRICAQALKLGAVLNAADITPMFLKGTARLLAGGGHLGFRKQADIDVLVEPHETAAAVAALLAAGYRFHDRSGPLPAPATPQPMAIRALCENNAHHHLPGLQQKGAVAIVELHRHLLPRRFQARVSLAALFGAAVLQERSGVHYLVPSAEYQLIHLVSGKWVHDGHLARAGFPLREACDFLDILDAAGGAVDFALVARHCGEDAALVARLVAALTGSSTAAALGGAVSAAGLQRRLRAMELRARSGCACRLLDAYARTLHLGQTLAHNPAKLTGYLRRLGHR